MAANDDSITMILDGGRHYQDTSASVDVPDSSLDL
jgi:hypothetical protein